MPTKPPRFFRRTRSVINRVRKSETSNALLVRVRERLPTAPRPSNAGAQALAARFHAPLSNLVDNLAGRLLSMDEAAAELAVFVERAVERSGHEAVLSAVLRKNLLLDGTILAFIEPMLRGKEAIPSLDPAVLERGRLTLLGLMIEITAIEELTPPSPDLIDDTEAAIEWLDDRDLDQSFEALRQGLRGEGDEGARAHFLMNSYMIFLQSFLMRSAVRMFGELLSMPKTPE